MSRSGKYQVGKLSQASSEQNGVSSPSSNHYNPIVMINEEINSEECRRLLAKVDKMREILQMEKISLPQIVVVGDQSVGHRLIPVSHRHLSFRWVNHRY